MINVQPAVECRTVLHGCKDIVNISLLQHGQACNKPRHTHTHTHTHTDTHTLVSFPLYHSTEQVALLTYTKKNWNAGVSRPPPPEVCSAVCALSQEWGATGVGNGNTTITKTIPAIRLSSTAHSMEEYSKHSKIIASSVQSKKKDKYSGTFLGQLPPWFCPQLLQNLLFCPDDLNRREFSSE